MFDLEALCDGILYLYNLRSGFSRQRALEVVKMRGAGHDTRMHSMEFTRKGLSVNAKEPLKL
ncbi:MAG: hypothetical protein NT157_03880 [Candidatus Micrarchaeota archaeon]|nr:hypothetical protein [Candidatus Micrarchaeota archaeon]